MNANEVYAARVGPTHLKRFGQFFTPPDIARFMVQWVSANNPEVVLDPALGNGVFQRVSASLGINTLFVGHEIDARIVDYFGVPESTDLHLGDYLLSDWSKRYPAIVANPPYQRFQEIANRERIREAFALECPESPSGFANLYVLFLHKMILQLAPGGRMAVIVPSEFLDSQSGHSIRETIVTSRWLTTVVSLDRLEERNLFSGAMTTACILLFEHSAHAKVSFVQPGSIHELLCESSEIVGLDVSFERLSAVEKWGSLFRGTSEDAKITTKLGDLVTVQRGIATGNNAFFLLSDSQRVKLGLADSDCTEVIARAADVVGAGFTSRNFYDLLKQDKRVLLFNPGEILGGAAAYIQIGVDAGISEKYLCKRRTPWYRAENRRPAPIWVGQASRGAPKVVRNLSGIRNLTTFHGLTPHPIFEPWTDAIFALLKSDAGSRLLLANSREMGARLIKFQPSDLTKAPFLDLSGMDVSSLERLSGLGRTLAEGREEPRVLLTEINDIADSHVRLMQLSSMAE